MKYTKAHKDGVKIQMYLWGLCPFIFRGWNFLFRSPSFLSEKSKIQQQQQKKNPTTILSWNLLFCNLTRYLLLFWPWGTFKYLIQAFELDHSATRFQLLFFLSSTSVTLHNFGDLVKYFTQSSYDHQMLMIILQRSTLDILHWKDAKWLVQGDTGAGRDFTTAAQREVVSGLTQAYAFIRD